MSGYAFHPDAFADLDEIWEYIAQDNVDAADRVLADIHSTLTTLAGSPQIGHRRPDLTTRPLRFHVARDEYLIAYAITPHLTSHLLVENNICHNVAGCIIPNDPDVGSVYAYNYINGIQWSGSIQIHSSSNFYNLYEGNQIPNFVGDILHGPGFFETVFRNHFAGYQLGEQVNENGGIVLLVNRRFYNLVGNVIGDSHFDRYQQVCPGDSGCGNGQKADNDAVFVIGAAGDGTGTTLSPDTNVGRTVMRWGNWDSVTSSNDDGTNDSTGTRFVSGEVPSGITNFPNPVPSTQTLPTSMFRVSKPGYFGSIAWPPIGPDVSSGTFTNDTGGHANKNPATVCFESLSNDGGYGGSPAVKAFDRATCYPGS